jgi:hypothetical protein
MARTSWEEIATSLPTSMTDFDLQRFVKNALRQVM